jgi:uncharacterized membrane protein
MWLVGAMVGGVLGAMLGGGDGAFFGVIVGGIAGWFGQSRASRLDALEKRIATLENALPGRSTAPEAAPLAPEPEPPQEPIAATPVAPPTAVAPAYIAPAVRTPQPRPAAEEFAAAGPDVRPSPGWLERLFRVNIVAKVGILVLFCGIAFLLKYAYERVHVPIELRLTAIAIGALVLLVLGWRLRHERPGYALILQGGGVGVLYLVIFAAFRMFQLLPAPLTFALLVGVAVCSAALSVIQNSLALAVVGVSGGFLAPILASTGQGSHVMLFSYYSVLNAGIVAIAWVKAWRVLNLVGFGFTFAIAWMWGAKAYRPEFFASTELFLLLFFVMYIAIPLLFARRRAVELKDYVDGSLVFGVPVVVFGLQTALVRDIEYGAAYSAFGLAVFYLVLALALFRRTGAGLRMLIESYVALSLAFGTLTIPLAFEGRLTSAAWALEGAAVLWIAVRQGRLLARLFGYLLQLAAGIAFLWDVDKGSGTTPILNSAYLGSVFLALAGLFCAAYMERRSERLRPLESRLSYVLLAWGALWWFAGGVHEITRHVAWEYRTQAVLIFFAASSVAFSLVSARLRWQGARWPCLMLYPAIVMQLGLELLRNVHPFAHIGALAWGSAFFAHLLLLARHGAEHRQLAEALHAAGVWVLALLGAREVGWLIDTAVDGKRVWPSIAWALVPAAMLAALASQRLQARWPVSAYVRSYVVVGGAPLAVFLAAWTLYANLTNDGDPYPLAFVPLLNPLDIAIGAVFLVMAIWLRAAAQHGLNAWLQGARATLMALAVGMGFAWVNGVLLRTLHHWAGLPFDLHAMLSSRLVQASFSIVWMLLALGAMVIATRRALRGAWVAGACLMGAVVAKLFLVDLSGVGTVERIVSFIGVGLLMLLIGYLSPVPPRQASA